MTDKVFIAFDKDRN